MSAENYASPGRWANRFLEPVARPQELDDVADLRRFAADAGADDAERVSLTGRAELLTGWLAVHVARLTRADLRLCEVEYLEDVAGDAYWAAFEREEVYHRLPR